LGKASDHESQVTMISSQFKIFIYNVHTKHPNSTMVIKLSNKFISLRMYVKNRCRRHKSCRFNLWMWKIPWRRKWQPTPVFLPGKSHGEWNLVSYSLWGHKDSDMTEAT